MKRFMTLLAAFCGLTSFVVSPVFAADTNVAKVGNTEYATIDAAIAAWTNNSTLTLLADVTLSDVVTLKSTEHHILNLGTYTMTAASGKNAFVIQACGTGAAERSAITINADATNPGGINAGSKCIAYYKYADGGISDEDRPIIKINGGVFTGSTSGTAGIHTIGTAARKCATINITGGTFNCSINGAGKSKLTITGGTFNYSVGSQGDSTCYRLISGGTFKSFGFMTADSNNTKFWIGTAMGKSDVGTYVDDNGYLVVGGPVVNEAGEKFEASTANYGGWSSYLKYSSAKDNGLYYTSVYAALKKNKSATVTVYADEVDMTQVTGFTGTLVVPEGKSITIITEEDKTPAWKVTDTTGTAATYTDASGNVLVRDENGSFKKPPAATIGDVKYYTLADAVAAVQNGETIVLQADITETDTITIPAGVTLNGNGKTIAGGIKAGGNLTFAGATTVNTFSAGWYNNVITIGEGASLKVTGGRITVSYGNTFNITGSIADAKTADKSTLTPSLEVTSGISFNGDGGGVNFNVKNAYVKLGDSTTKNSGATGEFNLNFENSIVDFTNTLKTYAPTAAGLAPVFNLTAKDSVVSFASHLELWLADTTMSLDNTDMTVGGSFANAGTVNLSNGANFVVTAPIMSSHGGNTGTITVSGGTFELKDSNEDWENAGTIEVAKPGKLIFNDFTCVDSGNVAVDMTGLNVGDSITDLVSLGADTDLIYSDVTVSGADDLVIDAEGKIKLDLAGSGTWGGIDWTLTNAGKLTIKPTAGTPKNDPNAASRTYTVGQWREAVRYDDKGEGVAIGGYPYDCNKVKKLVIEEGVTSIGSFSAKFPNFTGEVVIPYTVTYIGQEAFQRTTMTKLTFAAVPAGQTGNELCIAQGAFKNLIIEEVSLPADRPVHLHAWVFNNCKNLKHATLPASVTKVWGTNHIDYFANFEEHSNPTWEYSSELFAYDDYLETVTFGSKEVRDMFFANNNGTKNDTLVATAGLVSYTNLQAAINAAQDGDTIKLIKNVTPKSGLEIPAGKTLVFDLNGKTITGYFAPFTGNVTFANGTITNTNSGYSALEITAGTLVMTDVDVSSARHALRIDGAVTATITGGTYTLISTANMTHHVMNVSGTANVTINGGTFTGPAGTVSDSGSALNIRENCTANVYGGTFTGGKNNTLAGAGTTTLYGGTYDADVTAKCAEGYIAQNNGNGTWTVGIPVAQVGTAKFLTLQKAIDEAQNGDTITLLADVAESVTVVQAENTAVTIDGAGKTLTGSITIDGKSAAYATAAVTIKNIVFDGSAIAEGACINLGKSGDNNTRYTSNVTVQGCTFTGAGKVGIKSYTGGDKNLKVENCTATGMHSLAQFKNIAGVSFTGCTVTGCKNGIGIGNSTAVTVSGCEITAEGYGIRADAEANGSLAISDCKISAFIPVCVRKASADYQITVDGTNKMTPSNEDGLWCAIGTSEYEENGTMPTAATGKVVVTLKDTGLASTGIYGNYAVAQIGNVKYNTFADALAAAKSGDTIELLDNAAVEGTAQIPAGITIDLNGKEVNGTVSTLGDVSILGGGYIKTLSSVSGGTIAVEDGTILALNDFSFGTKSNNTAEYTITGGKITANYGFFQHGIYKLYSYFETGYMYYSYGSDITVYGTFHSQGKGDGLDYVRGKLTIAAGGKSIHEKSLWVGQPASWGAMESALIVEAGGTLEIGNMPVYNGSSLTSAGNITGKIENSANATIAISGGTYTQAIPAEWCADGFKVVENADGTYSVQEMTKLVIDVAKPADSVSLLTTTSTFTAVTMDEAVAYALANPSDEVVYQIYGSVELTTGSAHGTVKLGNNVTIQGMTEDAKLTIVGGGVPDIKGVTFKDITLADEGTYLPTANEFMYQNYIDCSFENVTFAEGIRVSGETTLTNCTINAEKANQYALWSDGGKVTMTNCLVSVGAAGYGMVKSDAAGAEFVLTGNTFTYEGPVKKEAFNTNGAKITATGNTFANCGEVLIPTDKTNYAADGETVLTEDAIRAGNTVIAQAVAKVGDKVYETIEEAIKAAAPAGTVEILTDVTVDQWKMFSETLSIAGGKIVTIPSINGLTIDGNGHTVTIKSIESAGNGGYLFYDATNLNVKDVTIACVDTAANAGGIGLTSGTIENVVFEGGRRAVYPGTGDITITGCTFKTTSNAIYYESARDNLKVTGNTFECGDYAIIMYGKETFTDNTVTSGKVNIAGSSSATVTGNDFGANRFKVYNGATATIENNTINNLVFDSATVPQNSTFANNTLSDSAQAALNAMNFVAKIGDKYYTTISAAIAAANAGDTITLVNNCTEDVTITKAVTIDGVDKTYTGAMTLKADTTIKNVNFDGKGYNGYAITTRGANYLTIEDCTASNYGYGFVQLASGTALTTVKNVTVSNMNYGVKVDYSNAVVLENVDIDAKVAAVLNSNYGEKTITIKDSDLSILGTWKRNDTIKTTYLFEGANSIDQFVIEAALDNFQLAADATLTAPAGHTVVTVADYVVVYEDGAYVSKEAVAQVGEQIFADIQEAIKAAAPAGTVTLLKDVVVDEWKMVTEDYNIASGQLITLTMNGLTIDGNGHSLTVNNVKSAGNGGYLFQGASNLTVKNLTINQPAGLGGIALKAGTIENVTFNGGKYAVLPGSGTVTVKGCTFNDITGYAVYFEDDRDNLVVTGNTFNCADGAYAVTLRGAADFTNNTVVKGRVNLANSAKGEVSGNDFGNERFKVYNGATATIENNTINNLVFDSATVPQNSTFANNTLSDSAQAALNAMNFVAKIGDKYYTTISAAITAAKAGETVQVFAGTYTVPSMKAGITIEGAVNADGTPAVLFEGTLSGTLENLTMKNIHIRGGNAQRWAYAKGDLNFENVIFEATSVYALHFDGIAAGTNLKYENCTIIGWAAMGGSPASCVFEGCTIKDNGAYGVIRTYFPATITGCTFDVKNANTTDAYEDGIHAVDGAVVTVTNCTNANGDMKDLVNVHADSVVTLDGVAIKNVAKIGDIYYATLPEALAAAQGSENIVIELLADATLDITAWETLAIGGDATKTITIDGNGNTLTFNKLNSDWNHIVTKNDAKLILNDMTITDSGYNNGPWNRYDINFACDVELNDVKSTKALAFKADATLNNVEVNETNDAYAIWIQSNGQNVAINGLTVTSAGRGIKIDEQYVDAASKVELSVKDATFTTAKKAAIVVKSAAGADITLENVDISGVAADNVNAVWNDEDSAAVYGNITVTGGTLAQEGAGSFVAEVKAGDKVTGYYKSLQTALDAAAAGTGNVTVEILSDIDLTGTDWNSVTVSAPGYPFVTVNGNNKTITGLNDMLFAGTWAGKTGLVINDLTIAGSTIVNDENDSKGNVGVGAFVGFPQASETITLNNCHLKNSTVKGGHWTGGLVGYAAGYAGSDGPVFMTLTITNCSVTASTITGKGSAGGIIGHGSGNAWTDVIIVDSVVSGNTITSTGSSNNKAGSVMGTIGAAGQPTTVNGVTKTGGMSVSVTTAGNTVMSADTVITTIYGRQGTATGLLEIAGGSYEANPIEEGVAYAAPIDGYKIAQNTDGTYGVIEDPTVYIDDLAELKAFRDSVNAGNTYEGTPVCLTADIDLGNEPWTPIGFFSESSTSAPFKGTFDGNNKTISNLTINLPEQNCVGLFGYATGATIKNIKVENVDIKGYSQVATIVGRPYSGCTISNCHVTGSISLYADWAYVGGIAGYGYMTVENCSVIATTSEKGTLTAPNRNAVGGITAWLLEDSSKMTNCHVKNLALTGWTNVGGLTGFLHRDGVIDGCSVENVDLTKTREDGHPGIGLASGGWSYNATKPAVVKNSTFENITRNGQAVYWPSADLMFGSEYAGGETQSLVSENNTLNGITDNLVLYVSSYEDLLAVLAKDNAKVALSNDITADATQTSGYGKAGIVLDAGDVLDGNGYTLTITGANSTWDCAIAMKGGTVKNLTIAGAMRGVFMPGANGDVVIDSCKFQNVVYTFNSDGGSKDHSVTIKNTELNGWTSFSDVHKSVTFDGCTFGEGSGYAYCRPYQGTTFNNCAFEAGFELDALRAGDNALAFSNCTYAGEKLTAENADALFNGGGKVVIDNVPVDFTKVAQVGDTKYTTLAKAFKAAQAGDTVTVLSDIVLTETVTVAADDEITLDLNGKTVSMEDDSGTGAYLLKNYGDLTITDSATDGKLTFATTTPSANNGYSTSTIGNAGDLMIEGGTIENTTAGGACYAIDTLWYNSDISLTIAGGTVKSERNAIRQVLYSTTAKNVLNVTGGTITGGYAAIQTHNFQTTARLGEVNISGGTITGNGGYSYYTSYSNNVGHGGTDVEISGGTFTGAVYVYNSKTGAAETDFAGVTVSGGTFKDVVRVYTKDAEGNTVQIGAISGGTHSVAIEEGFCAEGYIPVDNGDGTYGVKLGAYVAQIGETKYESLNAAIDAAQAGQTITLIRDVIEDVTITNTVAITIDFAEKTLKGYFAPFTGNVTLKNGTIKNENRSYSAIEINAGTLVMTDVNVSSARHALRIDGDDVNVTINGGDYSLITVNGQTQHVMNVSGTANVTINGGTFTGPAGTASDSGVVLNIRDASTATVNGGIFTGGKNNTLAGTITVKGGVYDQDPSAYTAEGYGVALLGDLYYVSLQAAIDAAQPGQTITVIKDVDTDAAIQVAKKVTIDLNGKTVKTTQNDKSGNGVFCVTTGGELTITGEGTVNGVGGNNYNIAVWANGGKVIINGGTYTNVGAGSDDHYDLIYAKNGGSVEINGGTFIAETPAWTLNVYDAHRKTSSITVTGGTFYGFNPEDNAAEGIGTDFCAKGYHGITTDGGVTYTVMKLVAIVTDGSETTYHETIESAIEDANANGGQVTIVDPSNITADEEDRVIAKTGAGIEKTGSEAANVAKVLGGSFKVDGDTLVYDYDLGITSILLAPAAEAGVYTLTLGLKHTEDDIDVSTRDLSGRWIIYTVTPVNGEATEFVAELSSLATIFPLELIETEKDLGDYVGGSRAVKVTFAITDVNPDAGTNEEAFEEDEE